MDTSITESFSQNKPLPVAADKGVETETLLHDEVKISFGGDRVKIHQNNPDKNCADGTEESSSQVIGGCSNEKEKLIEKNVDQDTLGDLTNKVVSSPYRNIGWNTANLNIKDIIHFDDVPDYILPTDAPRPIVVQNPKGYFCIEGWHLIERERRQGGTTIMVDVDHMAAHSVEELSLRKTELRINTRGGEATYAEIFRNTRDLLQMLLNSNENLRVFSHGGRRTNNDLTGNKEEDAYEILSRRLGKERGTISNLLMHAERLSKETIEAFIIKHSRKDFFTKVQREKRTLINKLIGEKKDPIEITDQVSTFMLEEYEKYLKDKEGKKEKKKEKSSIPKVKQKSAPPGNGQTQATVKENVTNQEGAALDKDDIKHDESADNKDNIDDFNLDEGPITVPKIKKYLITSTTKLYDRLNNAISFNDIEESIQQELKILTKALKYILSQKSIDMAV